MIVEETFGNRPLAKQLAERSKRELLDVLAGDGTVRFFAQRRDITALAAPEARNLAIADIIAMAAPGVEEPRPFASRPVEQPACGPDRLRPGLDRIAGAGDDLLAGHGFKSAIISPAVALALPTTPGIPAPGCVPAPTK